MRALLALAILTACSPGRSASVKASPSAPPAAASDSVPGDAGSVDPAGTASARAETGDAPDAGSDTDCPSFHETEATFRLTEDPPKHVYSVQGYVARRIRLESTAAGAQRSHCIVVAWPPADQNSDGQPVQVAAHLDDGWLRGIENTLERVPWAHATVLRRIVIDNRPKEHGIAPFEHPGSDDARDGHTIWLHERMFEEPNHWDRGNYGAYWSYHVDVDGEVLAGKPATHALFSPVLLHELGHLVSYNVLNGRADDPTVPTCAKTCADHGGCKELTTEEREEGCISPYCVPFQFDKTSTENWAEQYRFFYQGSRARGILGLAKSGCLRVLVAHDGKREERSAPWDRGLPDIKTFRKSLWDSCSGRACKAW